MGGTWPEMARNAAVELSGARVDSGSLGEQLIERLRALLDESKTDRLASEEICKSLATLEGESWAEYGRARKPITPSQLARLPKRFHVTPARSGSVKRPQKATCYPTSKRCLPYIPRPKLEQRHSPMERAALPILKP